MFTAIAVVCMVLAVTSLSGSYNAVKAETVSGTTPTFSETKIMKSVDGTMMLLATGINDYQDCYECGYVTEGLQAVTYNLAKYYTSISVNGGAKVWTTEDIFGEDYDGMIVWEVKNVSTETSFKPYVRVGDREDGVLVTSGTVEYGTERTLESVVGVSSSFTGVLLSSGLDEFATSEKALSFEYKTTDESAGTDTVTFTLWTADGMHRLTEIFTINVESNTLSGSAGEIKDIGDGWRRVFINCSDMPICTAEGADGTETIGLLFFNTVNRAIVVANAEFVDEDIHIGADTFTVGTLKNSYFGDTPSTSGVELDQVVIFDVKFATSGSLSFYLNEYYNAKYCGPFTLTSAGVLSGNGANSCESIGDGWYRIKINLNKASKSATAPAFVSNFYIQTATTASGFVVYVGNEDPDIHEDAVAFTASTQKDYYFVENHTTSGVALDKIIKIDVKFESEGIFYFYLNESWNGKYCGLYALTSAGVLSGSGAVSAESIDDGWYRIYIDLGKATKTNNPSFISRINIAAATTASGYVMYMGYDEPVVYTPGNGDSLDLPETITSYTLSDKYLTFKLKPVDPASTGTIQMKLASDSGDLSYGIRLVFNKDSAPTNGRAIASVVDLDDDGWYLITTQTCKQITGSAGDVTKLTFAAYSGYPSFYLKDLEVH